MKKFGLLLVFGFLSVGAWAQNDAISKYFGQYWSDPDFTTVQISQRMFEIVAQIPVEEDEEEVMEVIRSLDGMRFLASDKGDGQKMYREAIKTLAGKGFDELMTVREDGQDLQFLIAEADGKISELILVGFENGEEGFFLLSLTGNIDLKQIARLSKTLDVEGMEHLNNLGDDHEE